MARETKIRLGTDGADRTKRDLRDVGVVGDRALAQIRRGAPGASAGLRAVDAAAREVKSGVQGLASSAGPLGSVLGGLGTGGLAAAAGIGAMALGLTRATGVAKAATAEFDAVGKTADTLGVSTALLQEMRFAGGSLAGMLDGQVDKALQSFVRRSAEAANGTGEAKGALEDLGVTLRDSDGRLKSADTLLSDVARGMSGLESDAERLSAAIKLFGDEGAAMVNVLRDNGAAMDETRERARRLGGVVEDSLIRTAEQMQDDFAAASKIIDLNLKQSLIVLMPLIVRAAEGFGDIAIAFRGWVDDIRRSESDIEALARVLGFEPTGGGLIGFLQRNFAPTETQKALDQMERITVQIERIKSAFSTGVFEADTGKFTLTPEMRLEFEGVLPQLEQKYAELQRQVDEAAPTIALRGVVVPDFGARAAGLPPPQPARESDAEAKARMQAHEAALRQIRQMEIAAMEDEQRAHALAKQRLDEVLSGLDRTADGYAAAAARARELYDAEVQRATDSKTERLRVAEAAHQKRMADEDARRQRESDARLRQHQAGVEAIHDAEVARLDTYGQALAAAEAWYAATFAHLDATEAGYAALIAQAKDLYDARRVEAYAAEVQRLSAEMDAEAEKSHQRVWGWMQTRIDEAAQEREVARRERERDTEREERAAERIRDAWGDAARTLGRGINDAISGAGDLRAILGGVAESLIDVALRTGALERVLSGVFAGGAAAPGAAAVGSAAPSLVSSSVSGLASLFAADGAAFVGGAPVHAFAMGGVVDRATPFSFGGGRLGVMGEAGPEGILPLRRGADGKLGVRAQPGPAPQVNIQVISRDPETQVRQVPESRRTARRNLQGMGF